jgi:hypothetical protein
MGSIAAEQIVEWTSEIKWEWCKFFFWSWTILREHCSFSPIYFEHMDIIVNKVEHPLKHRDQIVAIFSESLIHFLGYMWSLMVRSTHKLVYENWKWFHNFLSLILACNITLWMFFRLFFDRIYKENGYLISSISWRDVLSNIWCFEQGITLLNDVNIVWIIVIWFVLKKNKWSRSKHGYENRSLERINGHWIVPLGKSLFR